MRSCTIVGSKTVIEVARVIGIAARSDLANLPLPPARKRLTFMLAGFVNNRHFVYRVTNMENAEGVVSREAGWTEPQRPDHRLSHLLPKQRYADRQGEDASDGTRTSL